MKTIVVIDDHKLIREAVCHIFDIMPDTKLLFSASNGFDFICKLNLSKIQPSYVFSDIVMPIMDGIATISYLKRHHPTIRSIAMSNFCNSQLVIDSINAGAQGYILKENLKQKRINEILNCCDRGEIYFDEIIKEIKITPQFDYRNANSFLDINLSEKEALFLELAATGITYAQIAAVMNVSAITVYNYQKSLKEKTGVGSRQELIIFAIQKGIASIARVKYFSK